MAIGPVVTQEFSPIPWIMHHAESKYTYDAAYAGPELWQTSTQIYTRSLRTNGFTEFPYNGTRIIREDLAVGTPLITPLNNSSRILTANTATNREIKPHCLFFNISRILARHRVCWPLSFLIMDNSHLGYPGQVHATIEVAAHALGDMEDEWVAAVHDVQTHLAQLVGSSRYSFQTVDYRRYHSRVRYPVSPIDPVIPTWRLLRTEIKARLKFYYINGYLLGLYWRWTMRGNIIMTMGLMVPECSGTDWALVRDEIMQILKARHLFGVTVEIFRDRRRQIPVLE